MISSLRSSFWSVALTLALLASADARAITSCELRGLAGVRFGAYDIFSTTPLDSMGHVGFVCHGVSPGDVVIIELSPGGASSFPSREMRAGSVVLRYNLYLDAARTLVWGDGSGGTSRYGPVTPEDGVETLLPVYGRVPALQNPAVGAYSDTVTVTVLF